ncbi:hypothetical protein BpHYR1_050462 [Brachionus plicatilis]|uniref:Uncharacterized protein n=1 Tax=Brachionus plicatilis TaxID=10195 RepID=A0A3M7RR76_BRAPC|nr:hypothetical protein BpHYR1_050462 [Brachionus plicatilis]
MDLFLKFGFQKFWKSGLKNLNRKLGRVMINDPCFLTMYAHSPVDKTEKTIQIVFINKFLDLIILGNPWLVDKNKAQIFLKVLIKNFNIYQKTRI